jgi:hypothetical protein
VLKIPQLSSTWGPQTLTVLRGEGRKGLGVSDKSPDCRLARTPAPPLLPAGPSQKIPVRTGQAATIQLPRSLQKLLWLWLSP